MERETTSYGYGWAPPKPVLPFRKKIFTHNIIFTLYSVWMLSGQYSDTRSQNFPYFRHLRRDHLCFRIPWTVSRLLRFTEELVQFLDFGAGSINELWANEFSSHS
jgi:hypothetical protein